MKRIIVIIILLLAIAVVTVRVGKVYQAEFFHRFYMLNHLTKAKKRSHTGAHRKQAAFESTKEHIRSLT